jgi:pyridinium-3,5-bisthiocarboxylic acid mononucleotide nickel chelatase
MKIAYFDCFCGASGSAILSALVDAGADISHILSLPYRLNLPGVSVEHGHILKGGASFCYISIKNDKEPNFRNLDELNERIDTSVLPPEVKENPIKVYRKIYDAIANIYGVSAEKSNIYDVTSATMFIEIIGICEALFNLKIKKVLTGTINIGDWSDVMTAQSQLILFLLRGRKIKIQPDKKNIINTGGAAILAALTDEEMQSIPAYKLLSTGYGTDCYTSSLRIMVGQIDEQKSDTHSIVIEFNVDDMNPQQIPYVIEKLIQSGAADAFVTPILMKKGRPGYLFNVTCSKQKEEKILNIIFSESSTIGVRKINTDGVRLQRRVIKMSSSFGEIMVKEIVLPGGNKKIVPEYEDCRRIAETENIALREVQEQLMLELNNDNKSIRIFNN